jgi:hypothetical protein
MLEDEDGGYMALTTTLARVHIEILLQNNVFSVLVISGCSKISH